jgi:isopentenyl phosphate kinase
MTVVLKLGGSVITRKDEPETVDGEALGRAAGAVARDPPDGGLVLVHGGGSFGHYHADRHGVSATDGSRDAEALAAIHAAMTDLNGAVIDALHGQGVDALPVRPLSLAHRSGDDGHSGLRESEGDGRGDSGTLHLPTGSVAAMLAEGFVPVLHGDVVAHGGKGGTILSGDEVVVSVARSLGAERVGVCSTVPGVLGADGEVVDRIDSLGDVAGALGTSDATDVTGGMAGKVRTLLDLSARAYVFGLTDLPAFLAGGAPGTAVGGAGP